MKRYTQVFVSADMVCIGVGIQYGGQMPAVLIQYLPDLPPGILIVPAVNQIDIILVRNIDTNLCRAVYDALEQSCPKGMCYIGIEYECSKNYDLVFHSKQYLKSRPETRQGSAHFLMMRLKPDQETGMHGLPLKGCVIQTPVSPDTTKIPAELFLYNERINVWTETVL